jgi:hypothetical protein
LCPRAILAARSSSELLKLSRGAVLGVVAFAVSLWAFVCLPLLDYPFLSDDYVFLGLYDRFERIDEAPQFFRPLFAFLFWSVASVTHSPVAFHALGFALHLGSTSLVYALSLRLTGANGPAVLAAIVFLLNPLQPEAVLWVSGLQETLWVFFVLAAVAIYVAKPLLTPGRVAAAAALIALGLSSKETAVSSFLLLPAADWWFFRFKRGKWLAVAYGAFVTEAAGYLLLRARFVALESTYLEEPSRYFIKQLLAMPYRFFAQPWNTTAIDVPGWVLAGSAMLVMTLIWWAIAVRRQSAPILAGALIVLASTLPVYSYFFVRSDLASARYLYCAAAGWGLIFAASVAAVARSHGVFLASAVATSVILAFSLHLNLRPWRTAETVVEVLRRAIETDQTPGTALKEWASRNGIELGFDDSIPREYQGVGIFINGYEEFVRLTSRAQQ